MAREGEREREKRRATGTEGERDREIQGRKRDMVIVGVYMQIHVRGGGRRQTKVGQEERHRFTEVERGRGVEREEHRER